MILLFIPSLVFAQRVDKVMIEAYCIGLETLEKTLEEYKEISFVRGLSEREPLGVVSLVMFVNPQTQTWTMVEKIGADKYCIIATGSKFEPVPNVFSPEPSTKKDDKLY